MECGSQQLARLTQYAYDDVVIAVQRVTPYSSAIVEVVWKITAVAGAYWTVAHLGSPTCTDRRQHRLWD